MHRARLQYHKRVGCSGESGRGRGGSANIRKKRTRSLRSGTEAVVAQSPVDLSALREMYSAALTVATGFSQELREIAEEVGRKDTLSSGMRRHQQKNLLIVGN